MYLVRYWVGEGEGLLLYLKIFLIFSTPLGFTCYFFFMAAFLWLSVLCYDIWLNFKDMNTEMNTTKNKKLFIIYSLYAWLGASIATIISFIIQRAKRIDDIYKPGIGINYCWLNSKYKNV